MEVRKISAAHLILLSVGMVVFLLLSGQKPSGGEAEIFYKQGQKRWIAGQYDSAYTFFRKAQSQAKIENNQRLWAQSMQFAGVYLTRQMQVEAATATLDSVIALSGVFDPLTPFILFARKERAYLDMATGDISGAATRYQQLAADCEKLPPKGDSIRATVYEGLGQANFYLGEYRNALGFVEKALGLYNQSSKKDQMPVAVCHNTLAIMQMYLSEYEPALENFLTAVNLLSKKLGPDHPDVLQVKTNIGVLYSELGLFWKSLEYHREVLEGIDRLQPSPHLNALLNMGSTLIAVGDYEAALSYFEQAEIWLNRFPGMAPESRAYIALNRSLIFREINQSENAIRSIRQSIQINQSIFGKDHPELITDYMQEGNLYSQAEKYDSALYAYEKVYNLARKHEGEKALRKGHGLFLMGETREKMGEKSRALQLYHQAVAVYRANGNAFDEAKTLVCIANLWRKENQPDSALKYHQIAWTVLVPELPFQSSTDIGARNHWQNQSLREWLVSRSETQVFFAEKTGDINGLKAALASAEVLFSIGDSLRHYYESPGSGRYAVRDELPVYEMALNAAWQLSKLTDDQTYADWAFQIAEKSKSGILRDHLRGIRALHFAGVPDSLIEKEQYFRQRLAALDGAIHTAGDDPDYAEGLKNRRFEINQSYRNFLLDMEQQYPEYYKLKFSENVPGAKEVMAQLLPGQAVYSYFSGGHYIFIFRIQGNDMKFFRVDNTIQLRQELKNWLDFIGHPPSEKEPVAPMAAVSLHLAQTLLPGLSDDFSRLLIIPDGELGYLPFESLPLTNPADTTFRNWDFLTKQYTVSYAYAASIWLEQNREKDHHSATYYGFAPAFSQSLPSETRGNFSPLTHNQEEVKQVARLLKGKALTGAEAKEATLKALDTRPAILHFATHAIADETDLMDSGIFFENDSLSGEDGILHIWEIYGLMINSPLTVLSACQTGRGPLHKGEGIMSLARAFQYSGSSNILSTLWPADDQAGATLTTDFFRFLAQKDASATALRKARQEWLQRSDDYHCHPYFWAGYVLIGEGGEVAIEKSGMPGNIGLSILSVIILGLIGIGVRKMWRRRKI
ncbi:MAG: CHAT domain-containing tetratricopeptide repeat protein [Bacteroidia bacterium]